MFAELIDTLDPPHGSSPWKVLNLAASLEAEHDLAGLVSMARCLPMIGGVVDDAIAQAVALIDRPPAELDAMLEHLARVCLELRSDDSYESLELDAGIEEVEA